MTEVETLARIQQIRDNWTPQRTGITTICFIDVEWLCDQLEAALAAGTFAEGVEAAATYMERAGLGKRSDHIANIRALQPPKPPAMEPQQCPTCKGLKKVRVRSLKDNHETEVVACSDCNGTGEKPTPAEPAASNSLDFYPSTLPYTNEGVEMTIKNAPASGSSERRNMFIEAGSFPKEVDGIPRRCRVDLSTPAETAIRAAVWAVEVTGCDERLTDAVVLLSQAQDKVADYLEGIERATAPPAALSTLYCRDCGTPQNEDQHEYNKDCYCGGSFTLADDAISSIAEQLRNYEDREAQRREPPAVNVGEALARELVAAAQSCKATFVEEIVSNAVWMVGASGVNDEERAMAWRALNQSVGEYSTRHRPLNAYKRLVTTIAKVEAALPGAAEKESK